MVSLITAVPVTSPDDLPVADSVYAGVSIADSDKNNGNGKEPPVPLRDNDADAPDAVSKISMPLVSINTDTLDMNWLSVMDFSDPVLRPTVITLPFMENYSIDNIEVKLRLLNVKF